eukprot:6029792-Ditylum_brightwellii.AAC.1
MGKEMAPLARCVDQGRREWNRLRLQRRTRGRDGVIHRGSRGIGEGRRCGLMLCCSFCDRRS